MWLPAARAGFGQPPAAKGGTIARDGHRGAKKPLIRALRPQGAEETDIAAAAAPSGAAA